VDSYPTTIASYYAITAKHSGKSLAVSDDNNSIVQQEYDGIDSQRMELRPVGDGYFSIVVRDSGQCLSIEGGSANVVPETYVGSDDQRWKVESIGGGYYKICAKHSYNCLAVSDDNVEQQQYAGKDSQRWKFEAKDLVTLYEHPDYEGKSKRYQGEVAVPYVEG
jgi:mannan endo-1,4-beta-mannosidase